MYDRIVCKHLHTSRSDLVVISRFQYQYLTDREFEVLELRNEGYSCQEVANELIVSLRTVYNISRSAKAKINEELEK